MFLADEGCKACEICHRDDRDSVVKIVILITGVNHPQVGLGADLPGRSASNAVGRVHLETEPLKILMSSKDFQGKNESGYRLFWNFKGTLTGCGKGYRLLNPK